MSDLAPRDRELLAESDALEGVDTLDDGHVLALRQSQEAAREHRALTLDDLCAWQQLIIGTSELRSLEVAGAWLAALNKALEAAGTAASDAVVAEILGDSFHRLETATPFAGADGRLGRLTLSYIATWFERPLIVLRAEDRASLAAARSSAMEMRCFMAGKLRETIVDWTGVLLHRTRPGSNADVYARPGGGELIIERHELFAACASWRAAAGS